MIRIGTLLLASVLLISTSADANVGKNMEFNVDGVLPSADADIVFINKYTPALESVFTVSGGNLVGMATPATNTFLGYAFKTFSNGGLPMGAGLIPGDPYIIEARMRLLDFVPQSVNSRACVVEVHSGGALHSVYFVDGAVRFSSSGNPGYIEFPVDTSQWHVVRIEGQGGGFTGWLDGNQVVTGAFGTSTGGDGFEFRLVDQGYTTHAEIDYIRFDSGESPVTIESRSWGGVKALFD